MRLKGPVLSTDDMLYLSDYPKQAEREFRGRTAIIGDQGSITYKELDEASDRFAAWLQRQDLPRGTRVAYLGKNSELLFPVLFGCIRAGCVLVPINWRYAVPEIEYVLRDSGARVLVHAPDFSDAASRASAALPSPPLRVPTVGDAGLDLRGILVQPLEQALAPWEPDAPCLQLYTSGTTGRPKGVVETHRKLSIARWMEVGVPDWADWHGDDVLLSAMPNFHSGGLSWMLIGLLRGLTCILTADASPANLLALSRRHQVTRTFVVPAVIRALVDLVEGSEEAAPPLKSLFYGAAPIDVELIQRCQRRFNGCGFAQYYGMTEVAGSATFFPPAEHRVDQPQRLRSVGRLLPAFEMEIRDPEGRALEAGRPGEIFLRTPTLMLGYWNQPDATAEAIDGEGWYRTGDGGYVDEDGYLFLTDRIRDMIISGGENVYPAEVEQALRRHPAILEVVVVAVADPKWGETVCAVVELRPGQSVTLEQLRNFARDDIAAYKLPRRLEVVSQLPRTATGKLQRGAARAQVDPSRH
ncbi:fatty-acyl-CoA synthase [Variovorax sp. HW608]|uniref:class I adenylate-forming enzyme family protein n=1 Tax=Variovorax sp. HW608 TaxID=1034889 RepID=UPI000820063F|nr:AMP-binding protein [Variovorax sp. HW608]SCK10664.1 fatty-acyl-CoA synthase [Variovorax sp. HW608]